MKKVLICPTSWGWVFLGVLPGIWLTMQQSEVIVRSYMDFNFMSTIALAVVLTWINLSKTHHLEDWWLPIFGTVTWSGWAFATWLLSKYKTRLVWFHMPSLINNLDRNLLMLFIILGGIAGIALASIITFLIYRLFAKHMPKLGWGLLVLLILITLYLSFFLAWPDLLLLLVPIALGFYQIKYSGLKASLMVVAFVPVWIQIFYLPQIELLYLASNLSDTIYFQLSLFILTYLPFFCFLIIMPVGILRASNQRQLFGWVLIPSLLTLICVVWARYMITVFHFNSLFRWDQYSLVIIQLWLPLCITLVLYSNFNQTVE